MPRTVFGRPSRALELLAQRNSLTQQQAEALARLILSRGEGLSSGISQFGQGIGSGLARRSQVMEQRNRDKAQRDFTLERDSANDKAALERLTEENKSRMNSAAMKWGFPSVEAMQQTIDDAYSGDTTAFYDDLRSGRGLRLSDRQVLDRSKTELPDLYGQYMGIGNGLGKAQSDNMFNPQELPRAVREAGVQQTQLIEQMRQKLGRGPAPPRSNEEYLTRHGIRPVEIADENGVNKVVPGAFWVPQGDGKPPKLEQLKLEGATKNGESQKSYAEFLGEQGSKFQGQFKKTRTVGSGDDAVQEEYFDEDGFRRFMRNLYRESQSGGEQIQVEDVANTWDRQLNLEGPPPGNLDGPSPEQYATPGTAAGASPTQTEQENKAAPAPTSGTADDLVDGQLYYDRYGNLFRWDAKAKKAFPVGKSR